MNSNLLEVSGLHVSAGEKEILHGVDLTVGKDETHVLMGPNGTGKSTLGYAITGNPEYTVTAGKIVFDGEDITRLPVNERAKKGIFLSFQNPLEVPGVTLSAFIRSALEQKTGKRIRLWDFKKKLAETMQLLAMDASYAERDLNGGTTLGADNGIGMAAAMAVLADKELKHGRIQALFTVDEETGLTGAFGLESGMIDGKYLLNLDSEDEAEIFIGCAGGIDTTSAFTYKQEALPAGKFYLRVEVKNLLGGHSGGDIHLGRGNANKLLARFLWLCMQRHEVHLCAIDGGNLRNAIPREAMAVIAVNPEEKEAVRAELNHYAADVAAELSGVDPNVTVDMVTADTPEFMIEDKVARALISALYAAPHGVIAMSHDIEGLVETSTNLASVKMTEPGKIVVATSQRSSVESEKYDIAYQVECLFRLAGAEPSHGDGYPGWKPNMHSRIKDIAVEAYQELYQQTPAIKAIHAGLECGLFLTKYPQLDMISFGPTLRGVHSPDEKMHIPAVEKFWNHLVLILEKVVLE